MKVGASPSPPDPRLSVAFSAIFRDPEAQMWAQKQQMQKQMVRESSGLKRDNSANYNC